MFNAVAELRTSMTANVAPRADAPTTHIGVTPIAGEHPLKAQEEHARYQAQIGAAPANVARAYLESVQHGQREIGVEQS